MTDRDRADIEATADRLAETDVVMLEGGRALVDVHSPTACADQPWGCWIHRPFAWALASAPVKWRSDRGIAERVCAHGVGHPDLQAQIYAARVDHRDISVHGCDGCCGPRPDWFVEWFEVLR